METQKCCQDPLLLYAGAGEGFMETSVKGSEIQREMERNSTNNKRGERHEKDT